jgi:hypothetical protein
MPILMIDCSVFSMNIQMNEPDGCENVDTYKEQPQPGSCDSNLYKICLSVFLLNADIH